MKHILDIEKDETELFQVFNEIYEKKIILFLGAGASITDEKKYLSNELIEYYRAEKNISYNPKNNIVDFVDKVFSIKEYDRKDFDLKTVSYLKTLKFCNQHKIIIDTPWISIITSNVDLMLENTIEHYGKEKEFEFIKNIFEFRKTSNSAIKQKIVKLHGCISDHSKYPLLFSTKDFLNNDKFYNSIFENLKQQSPDVKILFVGYSFSDEFGRLLMNKFDEKFDERGYYLLDPFIDEDEFNLSYYSSKNIKIIKSYSNIFFEKYSTWLLTKATKHKKAIIFNNLGKNINSHLQLKLNPFLKPINHSYENKFISQKNYYLGEEPNYNVIRNNFDIIKQKKIIEITKKVDDIFSTNNRVLYPLVYFKGSFGTGKTTFSYRFINHYIEKNTDCIALEIFDLMRFDEKSMADFIDNLENVNKIIFYSSNTELDLNFKKIREIQGRLSSYQFQNKQIIFIQSIRENILETYKVKLNITKEIYEFNVDDILSDNELLKFIEKLHEQDLVKYRSEKEKSELFTEIKLKFQNNPDQFLILLDYLEKGKHVNSIINTYKGFSNENTKLAFLYTSILYQYSIKMPVSLLKEIININWDRFIEDVIKIDGKGIFIQENFQPENFLETDLYFKIKHPIIAQRFIEKLIKKNDLKKKIKNICESLPSNESSVYVFINLIKSLINYKVFDDSVIFYFYDIAYKKLQNFQYFILNYSRNLEYRGDENSLKKALDIIEEYVELNEDVFCRNSNFIHRKAALNFELSKFYFQDSISAAEEYYFEAEELFKIKLNLDPSSLYSYKQYLFMLHWRITKWNLIEEEKLIVEFAARNLIKKANENLLEGIYYINKIAERINRALKNHQAIKDRIDHLNNSIETRPYGTLLTYDLFISNPKLLDKQYTKESIIEELEYYSSNNEVSLFLFHFYSERLNQYNYRMKFYDLLKNNKSLNSIETLNVLFYSFVAEMYSYRYKDAFDFIKDLKKSYPNSIKKGKLYWLEQNSFDIRIFEGKIIMKDKHHYFKSNETGGELKARIKFEHNQFDKIDLNLEHKAKIYFDYNGINALILKSDHPVI
jgi:hypothetical protein